MILILGDLRCGLGMLPYVGEKPRIKLILGFLEMTGGHDSLASAEVECLPPSVPDGRTYALPVETECQISETLSGASLTEEHGPWVRPIGEFFGFGTLAAQAGRHMVENLSRIVVLINP